MLICVPTVPGFDDFEIEADCIAEAVEKAEDYIEADVCGEASVGLAIDYRRRPYILEDLEP
jgi:hypothetical protein